MKATAPRRALRQARVFREPGDRFVDTGCRRHTIAMAATEQPRRDDAVAWPEMSGCSSAGRCWR